MVIEDFSSFQMNISIQTLNRSNMYNSKDIQFVGKHDYNRESAELYASNPMFESFSVNIFQWELKSSGKSIKPSKGLVRVRGNTSDKQKVFEFCEIIVKELDEGTWNGRRSITVK